MKETRLELRGADGIRLVASAFGDPAAQPVLLLHGGGQTRHAWGGAAAALASDGFYAIALDARGHGESDWHPEGHYELAAFAADLAAVTARLERAPAVVGASLGGLTSLIAYAAAAAPPFRALVLVDVAPRLEPEGVSRVIGFMAANPEGFASVEEAAEAIAAYLPHRRRPRDLSGLSKNLRLRDDGRYYWHWDPRFIDRMDPDPSYAYDKLAAAARSLAIPTLLVRGRQSDVISEQAAADFAQLAPHSEFVDIASAAHMVAGDRNDAFAGAVREFLSRVCASTCG